MVRVRRPASPNPAGRARSPVGGPPARLRCAPWPRPHFRIFGIPIRVEPFFVIVAALFGIRLEPLWVVFAWVVVVFVVRAGARAGPRRHLPAPRAAVGDRAARLRRVHRAHRRRAPGAVQAQVGRWSASRARSPSCCCSACRPGWLWRTESWRIDVALWFFGGQDLQLGAGGRPAAVRQHLVGGVQPAAHPAARRGARGRDAVRLRDRLQAVDRRRRSWPAFIAFRSATFGFFALIFFGLFAFMNFQDLRNGQSAGRSTSTRPRAAPVPRAGTSPGGARGAGGAGPDLQVVRPGSGACPT